MPPCCEAHERGGLFGLTRLIFAIDEWNPPRFGFRLWGRAGPLHATHGRTPPPDSSGWCRPYGVVCPRHPEAVDAIVALPVPPVFLATDSRPGRERRPV